MAKMDSITISRTIGTESNNIARPSFPEVKSCSVPLMDSHMSRKSCFNRFFSELFCEDRYVEEYKVLLMLFSFKMLMPQL